MLTLTYIIDGNNLAHELFRPAARGQAQAGADRRLVEHLSAWVARRRPGRVAVEVYFDGAQEALADLPGVKGARGALRQLGGRGCVAPRPMVCLLR